MRIIYFEANKQAAQRIFDISKVRTAIEATMEQARRNRILAAENSPDNSYADRMRHMATGIAQSLFWEKDSCDLLMAIEHGVIVGSCGIYRKDLVSSEDRTKGKQTCLIWLGSTIKGTGTALMASAAKLSLEDRLPLYLTGTKQSKGFYLKMGGSFNDKNFSFLWQGEQLRFLAQKSSIPIERNPTTLHAKLPNQSVILTKTATEIL